MHSSESLEAELERLQRRPGADSAPPVLCEFAVDVSGDPTHYVNRLRSVLSAAVTLGATADFEEESLPVDDVPDWFVAISSGDEGRAPDFAKNGRNAYRDRVDQPWELQNWLYRFDPDEDSRGWEWWDITAAGPSRVHVWVDSWGESFFGCQELRWAAYTAGALRVEGPTVRRSEAWVTEAAEGAFDAS
ncbi:hypothetical protein [Streptomyces sp. NPDC020681]|uniref:hypothetical protein n=1 Tax=Streptomyces sp. NPDC020681 TaxID=3365083 RepID=UPI003790BCCC